MPFHGVLPERRSIFQPQPVADIGVNDREAYRLNPQHQGIYNKLKLARWQGLMAAACDTPPRDYGIADDQIVFVKPIINLAGMSLNARALRADQVTAEDGSFWCEQLSGAQSSSDCLVQQGHALWFAHTRAAAEKNQQRPIYWEIGVDLPENETIIRHLLAEQLPDYTGLINVEIIDGRIIEVHLRGSNAFFDFYGDSFIPAWVNLVDHHPFEVPPDIPGGVVYSVFAHGELPKGWEQNALFERVTLQIDHHTADRLCILRGADLSSVQAAAHWIQDKIVAR